MRTSDKPSLARLAAHLEHMASGQEIIVRIWPELNPGLKHDDLAASQEITAAAARVLRALAPFEDELREWLKENIANAKSKRTKE